MTRATHSGLFEPARPDPAVSADEFRSIFRRHPAGVAVIALSDGERPFGFTVTSVISVSLEPPLLAFSVATGSTAGSRLRRADSLTVNFLAHDQAELSERFAGRGADRFGAESVDGVDWVRSTTGDPVLVGTSGWVCGRVRAQIAAGRSRVVIVEATATHRQNDRTPLLYLDHRYGTFRFT